MKSLVLGTKCLQCANNCSYVCDRRRAHQSGVTLMPYQLYFSLVKASDIEFDERDAVFCDECHNIPSIVQNNYMCTIKFSDFDSAIELYKYCCENNEIFNSDKSASIQRFLSYYENIDDIINKSKIVYGQLYRNAAKTDSDIDNLEIQLMELLTFWTPVIELYNGIKQFLDPEYEDTIIKTGDNIVDKFGEGGPIAFMLSMVNSYGAKYLIKDARINNKEPVIELKFAREDALVNKALIEKTPHQILLSATPGDRDAFITNIGARLCDDNTIIWKELESSFNFEKSPIFFVNRYKMTYYEKAQSLNALKYIIDNILLKHENERGMILTHSYDIKDEVFNRVSPQHSSRLISYDSSKDKDSAINRYKTTNNGVLVGPTLDEGIDLPGDYCRFIIILKVPYPTLADKLTKAKMGLFPRWYQSATANSMIQGIGRGNRFENDWCTTYILDASFDSLLKATKNQWPDWILNRIKILQ